MIPSECFFGGIFVNREVEQPMGNRDKNGIILSSAALEEKQQELETKERALAEKESLIKKAEERIAKTKYNLYDKIDVSLDTMNKVVGVVALSLIAVMIYAVVSR